MVAVQRARGPYRPSSNAGYLRGLEWVIGEWVDEAEGPEIEHISFQWSPEGNFIVSTQAVTLSDVLMSRGTQWIGWDPAANQVRSWALSRWGIQRRHLGAGGWKMGHQNQRSSSGRQEAERHQYRYPHRR